MAKSNLKIVFLSDWLSNPYKELLIQQLENQGASAYEYYWSTIFIQKALANGVPNVLHFHTIHPFLIGKSTFSRNIKLYLFIAQLVLLKLLGTKTVWTVHEWNNKLGDENANVTAEQAAKLGFIFHAIITHCQTTQQDIVRIFKLENTQKVFVIPHGNYIGIYANTLHPIEARQQLALPEKDTVFLLFGDIYRYKGVLESIEAFKQLNHPQATLIIAGLPREERLQAEIATAIDGQSKILFLPKRIPDDEVQQVMNACDYVLVPYNVFTTSGVAVLAMSFGKACIAPNIGFFNDVLEASGAWLYDANQPTGLLSALEQAVADQPRAITMGHYNLQVAEQWSWESVATQTLKAYS
jgi:beta-1,4-mannosyltransferase